ncbi:MAG: LacI family DNA-binding transcriptional regulator [Janthinobacterium lividum]
MPQSRTSIADLARVLHLAPSTVSRALSGNAQISASTRQRVRQIATELDYHPHPVAAALRKGRTTTLGVLVPHLSGSFFTDIIDSITDAASQAGYHVLLCQSHEDEQQEKQQVEQLLQAQVAGLLVSLASSTHEFSHFETLRAAQVPVVFFDRAPNKAAGLGGGSIVVDDYAGAYAAVAHLAAQGRQRIAHFAGPLHLGIYQQRYQGYRAALRAHGLPYQDEWLHVSDLQQADGAHGLTQLLQLSAPPDAVFAASDSAAVGAMQVAKEHGLRIPQDLAFVGFSNAEFSGLTAPPLTTVDQCSHVMGRAAVQLLLQLLHGASSAVLPPVVLAPELLVRGSSRPENPVSA